MLKIPSTSVANDETGELVFNLENIQQAYWVGENAGMELSVAARYYVEVDIPLHCAPRLNAALQHLIWRHDMLRAVVLPLGEQRILQDVPNYDVTVHDLSGKSESERALAQDMLRQTLSQTEISSEQWPQFDIQASQDENTLRLHLNFALWMMDGWSLHVFLKEFVELCKEGAGDLPPIEMLFSGYIAKLSEMRNSEKYAQAWNYWTPRLTSFPGPPELPRKRNAMAAGGKPIFNHCSKQISAAEWQEIAKICRMKGITPNLFACAVYSEVLARYSGGTNFAISVLYSGRFKYLPAAENVFGNFGTTILLERTSTPDSDFTERAKALQMQFWSDAEHAQVSGIEVSRAIQRQNASGPGIGVPVTFTTVGTPAQPSAKREAVSIDHASARLEVPQVYLDHQMHFSEDGTVAFNWDYVTQIFPDGFVETLAEAHHSLMLRLAKDISLWEEADIWADPEAFPHEVSAQDVNLERLEAGFERKALEMPDQIAVVSEGRQISYFELRQHAGFIAQNIRDRGIGPDQMVAVCMHKGWEQVAAVLGVLYAGAAYIPVAADLPESRRNALFSSSEASLILTQTRLDKTIRWPTDIERIPVNIADIETSEFSVVPPPSQNKDQIDDIAYVIFTSGSTGAPKGVVIDHRGAANTIADINNRFQVTSHDKVLGLSSLSFDLSVYDIFGTLAVGGTIVLPDAASEKDIFHWRELVNLHGVTIWNSVPALMQLAADGGSGAAMPSLRLAMLSGDWIPLTLPERLQKVVPNAITCSLGGATEASIWSVIHLIERVDLNWNSIPYGRALENQSIFVLDEHNAICPPWVPGEIYIGGIGVAIGYWRDPNKTAAAFISHPETGARLYRTGDLGHYLQDGQVEFLGRSDFQVKVQGFRIECAEVEAAILTDNCICAAVVTTVADSTETRHLVAYIVAETGKDIPDVDRLQEKLRGILPGYMVPTSFVTLETLPLSDNGKVMRSALPKPQFGEIATATASPLETLMEHRLGELWCDVLGVSAIGRHDNFFALGGTSFSGMRLMARLTEEFDRRLTFALLIDNPTISDFSDALQSETDSAQDTVLVRLRDGNDEPPLFCVHPIGGNVLCYTALVEAIAPGRTVYGVHAPGLFSDEDDLLASISDMAQRYISEIRQKFPNQPLHLVGWSLGGLVVQEMARCLAAAGDPPALVAMIDSEIPKSPTDDGVDDAFSRFSGFVADLMLIAGGGTVALPNTLKSSGADHWFNWLAEQMSGREMNADSETLRSIFRVFDAGITALHHHIVRSYDGEIMLFNAMQHKKSPEIQQEWRNLMPQITIVGLEADHYTIIAAPVIQHIADKIT